MKKLFAAMMFACLSSASAYATTVTTYLPAGQSGGSYGGFTYTNFSSLFDVPIVKPLYQSVRSSVSYDAGAFDYHGITLNFLPYELSGSGSIGWDFRPYDVTLTFKDINGAVIDTTSVLLEGTSADQSFAKDVLGVHEIVFSTSDPSANYYMIPRFVALNISAVPEPETYAMLLAGLALAGVASRRRKAA